MDKDTFFSKTKCDRCGASLKGGRIMSMYNEDCICMKCKALEMQRPDYIKAVSEVEKQHRLGNDNFKGIGLEKTK